MHPAWLVLIVAVSFLSAPFVAASEQAASARQRPVRRAEVACEPRVVTAATSVMDIAIDGSFLYFTDFGGNVRRAPRQGGESSLLGILPSFLPLSIDLDDQFVYVAGVDAITSVGSVFRLPKEGGSPVLLRSEMAFPWEVAVSGDSLFVVLGGTSTASRWRSDGSIVRMRKDGSVGTTLAAGLSMPMALAVSGDFVYFTEFGAASGNSSAGVRRVPREGGPVERLADHYGTHEIEVTADAIHFIARGTGADRLLRIARDGGNATLFSATIEPTLLQDLHTVGTSVFFANEHEGVLTIDAVSLETGQQRIVVTGGRGSSLFAADTCSLYYSTQGAIERQPAK